MRDSLSFKSERELDNIHNYLKDPDQNPHEDIYSYLYELFANNIKVEYRDFEIRPLLPEELDGIDGFDLFFKMLQDRDYLKLDSIYFDMNKEAEG